MLPTPTAPPTAREKWAPLLAACVGLMMLYVDLFIVNVALPAIERDFRAPLGTIAWAISGYVLMIAVLPMGLGRLGDLWGQRRLYLAGLALFVVASLACAVAPTIGVLIAARVVQGIGAAIMTPATLAIATRAFPPTERGLAVGIYGGVAGLGLVAGPVLGGLLVRGDNWRGIFLINLPIGLLAIALALRFVPESRDETASRRVDWWGLGLLSTGLSGLMLAITRLTEASWRSPAIVVPALVGVGLLAAFVAVEARVAAPLIDLALFRNRPYVLTTLSFFLFSSALFGSQPYWSLFMQNYWGFTPLQGGLGFVPATALIAVLTPFTGILAKRVGSRLYLASAAGVFALGLGCLYVAFIGPDSTYLDGFLPGLLIRGLGIPIFSTFATLALLGAVPADKAGLASGTIGMARNVGTAFGVSILGVIYHSRLADTLASGLRDLPAADAARITAAAANFAPTGPAAARAVAADAILGGFATISLVAALFCGIATIAALAIRPRRVAAIAPSPPRGSALAVAAED